MTVVFVHRLILFEYTCTVYMHVAVIAYAPDCDIRADAIEIYPDSSSLLMANAEEILETKTREWLHEHVADAAYYQAVVGNADRYTSIGDRSTAKITSRFRFISKTLAHCCSA